MIASNRGQLVLGEQKIDKSAQGRIENSSRCILVLPETASENPRQPVNGLAELRELHILVSHQAVCRRLCKLAFTRNDASIYLFAYARHGNYFYGGRSLLERQAQDTFDFTQQSESKDIPKLSIHQSGSVHAKVGKVPVDPLRISPLATLRGQHIATVCADSFGGLPPFKPGRNSGATIYHIIPVEKGVDSGRLAIYINGIEPQFVSKRCRLIIQLRRPCIRRCLHVGLAPIAQFPLGTNDKPGVTVIAGWDPTRPINSTQDYLYIRGA